MDTKRGRGDAGRRYAAAIFDFEGTLVDFQWRLEPAEAELRRAFGGMEFDGEEFARGNYASMWNAAADLLEKQGRMAELRRALCPVYDRWDADALSRWAPRAGALELLRGIAAAGSRAGMVSNIGRRALGQALARFGYERWLAPVVSRDDVTWMKPRAEGILRVLAQWDAQPQEVLFVGDSRADVMGARAAGVAVAIVRGGECEESVFADDPPEHMVSRLGELAGLIGTA
jgi:phosphoglycolate phosphatase-like HAD superfamily hydrolase